MGKQTAWMSLTIWKMYEEAVYIEARYNERLNGELYDVLLVMRCHHYIYSLKLMSGLKQIKHLRRKDL